MPRGDIDSLVAEAVAHVGARCPRRAAHPDTATVLLEARSWAQRTGLTGPADDTGADAAHPVAAVGEAMAGTPVGVLRVAGLFATWLAALEAHGTAHGWDTGYAASLAAVLRDGRGTAADPPHLALTDLTERIVAVGGAALLPDLADALDRHCAAARREQDWRIAETAPELAEFLDNRVDRTTVPLLTTLQRLDPAHDGPDDEVAPLHELAGLLVGLDEDVTGYARAVETGTRVTLVPVLMREYGHSVPSAFQSATVLFGAWKAQLDHGVRAIVHHPGTAPGTVRSAHAAAAWVGALHRRHAALAARPRVLAGA